jgi:hypothetical protein
MKEEGTALRLMPRARAAGSRLAELPKRDLRMAKSVDEILADERDR